MILIPSIAIGFGVGTTKKIDTIENNTGTNITLSPVNAVVIDTLTGNFVMQSSGAKELEESAITTTELGYLSGATSSLQTQIDGKENTLPWISNNDIVVYNGAIPARLAIGAIGHILGVNAGGNLAYTAPPSSSPTVSEGDIIMNNGGGVGNDIALAIGTVGQILVSTGSVLQYQNPPSTSPTTTEGDTIVRGASEDERLPIGTANQLLTSNGTTANWQDAPVSTTLTTKGDLQTFDTANARLPVGVDGSFLVADSTQATGLGYSTYLQGTLNAISDTTPYTPAGHWTSGAIYSGNYSRMGDKISATVTITFSANPSPAGDFRLTSSELFNGLGIAIDESKIPGPTASQSQVGSGSYRDAGAANRGDVGVFYNKDSNEFQFSTSSFSDLSNLNPITWVAGDSLTFSVLVPITGWTNGLDSVVSNKVLDATNANELSATFSGNLGAGIAIISEKYTNAITCTYSGSAGIYNCVVAAGLTAKPSITCTTSAQNRGCTRSISTPTTFEIRTYNSSAGLENQEFSVVLSKDKADVNKNVIMAATLQGINSTDLVVVEAAGNSATSPTVTQPIPFTEVSDTQGQWNGDTFTPTKEGIFSWSGSVYFSVTASRNIYLYADDGGGYVQSFYAQPMGSLSNNVLAFNIKFKGVVGTSYQLREVSNAGLLIDSAILHHMMITQSADYEAIVKNLSLESDRCQTKILSASSSSVGTLSDLVFNNLVVGKKYFMSAQVSQAAGGFTYLRHDGVNIAQTYDTSARNAYMNVEVFTATATTAEVYQGNTNTVDGNGLPTSTRATLCYKGNTVTTTEFN